LLKLGGGHVTRGLSMHPAEEQKLGDFHELAVEAEFSEEIDI
jgi:hypothetical protein